MQPVDPLGPPLGPLNASKRAAVERAEAMNRLATGLRINRAADDPAGLIASEDLRAVLAALEAETRAIERNDAVLNTADAALAAAADTLSRADALAVQSANTAAMSDAERAAIQLEMDGLAQSAARTLDTARFNGQPLFDGRASVPDAAGAEAFALPELRGQSLASALDAGPNGGDPASAAQALRDALETLNTARGEIGAYQKNDLGARRQTAGEEVIAVASSLSAIRDTDYAAEAAREARAAILERTTLTVLALAASSGASAFAVLG